MSEVFYRVVWYHFQRGILVWILVVIWYAPGIQAQSVPSVDSLDVAASDSLVVIDPHSSKFSDKDGVYSLYHQNLRIRLIYKGNVREDSLRGAVKLRGRIPVAQKDSMIQDSMAMWVIPDSVFRRPAEGVWIDSVDTNSVRKIPVVQDGGFLKLVPETMATELFQVSPGIISRVGSQEIPALGMRPTVLKADGNTMWAAGVVPGEEGQVAQGFLARRNADSTWSVFSRVLSISDTINLDEILVTTIAASVRDVWFGTVNSGLLRIRKQDGIWFNYTAGKDSLSGNGITALGVENDTTIWIGVKDSLKGRGVERVQVRDDRIEVLHLGGLPVSRVPFPFMEAIPVDDPDPDYIQVLRVDPELTLREACLSAGVDTTKITNNSLNDTIAHSFPNTLRIPNPRNLQPDIMKIAFPRIVSARKIGTDTLKQVSISPQIIGDTLRFPPRTITFTAEMLDNVDNIPDSLTVTLPEPLQLEEQGKVSYVIVLQDSGSLQLPDTTLSFPDTVDIPADPVIRAAIFADKGMVKLRFTPTNNQDNLLVSLRTQNLSIPNSARLPDDPRDYVYAPRPDSILAQNLESKASIWVSLDSTTIRIGKRYYDFPDSMWYQRVNPGVPDSISIPFPSIVRIPSPGEIGQPDFAVSIYQPPEDSLISAIAIDSAGVKWVGTGGSGLARLRDSAGTVIWDIIPSDSLRARIIFNILVEKDAEKRYVWAGTDAGLIRIEVDSTLDDILTNTSLVDTLRAGRDSLANAEALSAWLGVFGKNPGVDSTATRITIASDTTAGNQLLRKAQASLNEVGKRIEIFSVNNCPIPDNIVRGIAQSDGSKWIATFKGLVRLRDDKVGKLHRWNLYTARQYGGIRDSITTVEVTDGSIWLGRLPTWYSDFIWPMHQEGQIDSLPLVLERVRSTAYFKDAQGRSWPQSLPGFFTLDHGKPGVRGLGIITGKSVDTTQMDTLFYLGRSEISASVEDTILGHEGIDSIKVYINPTDPARPDSASLLSPSRYRFGERISHKVYSSETDSGWYLQRQNFSLVPGSDLFSPNTANPPIPGLFTPGVVNSLVLEVVDRARNRGSEKVQFYVKNLGTEPDEVRDFLNYPNPFGDAKRGPITTFHYILKNDNDRVSLRIYDISGALVNILVRNEKRSSGEHYEIWNGVDHFGQLLANGVYFCELDVGGTRKYTKVVVLR